jgi:hypothetical protein
MNHIEDKEAMFYFDQKIGEGDYSPKTVAI